MKHSNPPSRDKVAGAVVLYNSPPTCLDNLKTYLNQVQKLYIIDNSPTAVTWIDAAQAVYPIIEYVHFPQNVGIATALNKAADLAIADGFFYLLTMDDDSQAPPNMVDTMLAYLDTVESDTVGIVAPRHLLLTAPAPTQADYSLAPRHILTTMTSGNLLTLRCYQAVGPFCDALFIDVVDHEYNLRLKQAGYLIIELPSLILTHRLGLQKRRLGLSFVSHTPLRNYYLVRNSIFVAGKYWRTEPGYLLTAFKTTIIEFAKGAVLEDQPLTRLRLITRGIADGLRRKISKLHQP